MVFKKQRKQFQQITARLNRRERRFIAIGAAGLLLFAFLQLIVFPLYDQHDRLERQRSASRRVIEEMTVLEKRYAVHKQAALAWDGILKKRPRDFSLFSHVEKLAGRSKIMGLIAFIKPSLTDLPDSDYRLSRVEIKFVGLSIKQLVDYLHVLESDASAVQVSRLSIDRKDDQAGRLDVVMLVETPVAAPSGTNKTG
jgi:hypothetical protein